METHYHIEKLRIHVDRDDHVIKVNRHINGILANVESGKLVIDKEDLQIFKKICSRMGKYKYAFRSNADRVNFKILLLALNQITKN